MWAAWCAALCLGSAQIDPRAEASERIEAGRLLEALELSSQVEDPAARQGLRTEIWYAARLFARARAEARLGLAANPHDARLALRAAQAALWVRAAEAAHGDLQVLAAAVEATIDPNDQPPWHALVRNYQTQVEALRRERSAAVRGGQRARWIVAGAGAVVLLLLAFALSGPKGQTADPWSPAG